MFSPLTTALLLTATLSGFSSGDNSQYSTLQFTSGPNSVDDTSYDYAGYSGLYDRQDGVSLTDLSMPMLVTAFAAAFLASLIASSVGRMLSLEFKIPEFKAIPISRASTGKLLGEIDDMYSKYQD